MKYVFHKKDLNFFNSILRFFYRIIVFFFKPKKKYIKQIRKLGLKYLVFIDEHVGFRMLFPGLHESDEIKILDDLSKIIIQKKRENIHFIDVGANFGLFTLYFSKLLNSKGYVYAIEPDNECCKLIKESAQINNLKNISINNCAISDKVGFTEMRREDDETSYQTSLAFVGKINAKSEDLNKVEVTTLDSIFEKINNEIDIIKIDVEGHEASVINGFKLSLSNPDKSPNLALTSTSYIAEPVLSTMSMNGVDKSFGFALILIKPLPVVFCPVPPSNLPVETTTCPSSYCWAVKNAGSPSDELNPVPVSSIPPP